MNKRELLKLISEQPENVIFAVAEYDEYGSESWEYLARGTKLFYNEKGVPIYIFNNGRAGDQFCELKSKDLLEKEKIQEDLIESFPASEYWSIEKDSVGRMFTVIFNFKGVLKLHYLFSSKRNKFEFRTSEDQWKDFKSWDDFFAKTKPYIQKQLQKAREDLESSLDAKI